MSCCYMMWGEIAGIKKCPWLLPHCGIKGFRGLICSLFVVQTHRTRRLR